MGKLIFMRRFWEYGKRMKIRKLFEDNSKIWNRQPLFDAVWKKDTETATKEMNKLLEKQSVITIIKKISTMHFLQEFLQEQDIWWNQIKNMEKAEVMWLFMTL